MASGVERATASSPWIRNDDGDDGMSVSVQVLRTRTTCKLNLHSSESSDQRQHRVSRHSKYCKTIKCVLDGAVSMGWQTIRRHNRSCKATGGEPWWSRCRRAVSRTYLSRNVGDGHQKRRTVSTYSIKLHISHSLTQTILLHADENEKIHLTLKIFSRDHRTSGAQ